LGFFGIIITAFSSNCKTNSKKIPQIKYAGAKMKENFKCNTFFAKEPFLVVYKKTKNYRRNFQNSLAL
jgi:hypothetical protein